RSASLAARLFSWRRRNACDAHPPHQRSRGVPPVRASLVLRGSAGDECVCPAVPGHCAVAGPCAVPAAGLPSAVRSAGARARLHRGERIVMNPDGRLLIPVHVMARQLGAETVLLDVAKGGYFGLDEVGTRIWQLVGEGRTLGEIQAQLCEEYEADAGRIQADLE